MIDTVRGVLRVRKWPKKRGTPKSPLQRWWNDWFRQANLLAKYADSMTQARAIALTKGTGLYPRDIILKAMRGRLYYFRDETGKVWYPMAAVTDISETLDILAQDIGSVLVRAVDRWRAPPVASVNDVLTYKGLVDPPVWQAPSGGGGMVQEVLSGTPIVPDGTVSFYDLDVSLYKSIEIQFDDIGFSGSDRPWVRLSLDGGATFKSGATDYSQGLVSASSDAWSRYAQFYTTGSTSSAGHNAVSSLNGLRVGRASHHIGGSFSAGSMVFRQGFFNYDGPITDVRLLSQNGNDFTAGTIRVVGTR